jgi:alanine or glycine:cation symporter, AGCS family
MTDLLNALEIIEGLLWHNYVLYTILGVGVLFTGWTIFGQWRAMTHGVSVIRGKYDKKGDPGAINHFQALSAALSATVGLGNIGGVALAISLGGPGAVFWMWVVGFFGMAIKMTEVTQSMLYRNTTDPDNPHGGPMWVCEEGFKKLYPTFARFGVFLGGLFVITLIISTMTGGNMFQAWNVGEITFTYFGIPKIVCGIVLAIIVGMVIVGGIKRIGAVAGRLVPFMCVLYFLAAIVVLIMNFNQIPGLLRMIVVYAFAPGEAAGAFVGGTAGFAFLWGMKRALFSNEAGQGSAPIAHSAAKTDEPVREGVVAGLEPFIDTIVVCTLTALVILSSGIWNRTEGEASLAPGTAMVEVAPASWSVGDTTPPQRLSGRWRHDEQLFVIVERPSIVEEIDGHMVTRPSNTSAGTNLHRLEGRIIWPDERVPAVVAWNTLASPEPPQFIQFGEDGSPAPGPGPYPVFENYQGATLTGKAFDMGTGTEIGKYLVTLAAWLFAISTMIAWSYYGEQGVIYLFGSRMVFPYKILFCSLIVVATTPLLHSDHQVGILTGFGTGVMLFANIPIMLLFGRQSMREYHNYLKRLDAGEFKGHAYPSLRDVAEGRDVE